MRAAAAAAFPSVIIVGALVVSLECLRVGASVSTEWTRGVLGGLVNAAAADPAEVDVDNTSTATAHSARRPSTDTTSSSRASGALSVKHICGAIVDDPAGSSINFLDAECLQSARF